MTPTSSATTPGRHQARPHAQDATVLTQLARYLDMAGQYSPDLNDQGRADLRDFAQAVRDVAGMLMSTRRTMRDVVTNWQREVQSAAQTGDVALAQRLLKGLQALPDAAPNIDISGTVVDSFAGFAVAVPEPDGIVHIPVYEPDRIPDDLRIINGGHLTGEGHGKPSQDVDNGRFVLKPSPIIPGANLTGTYYDVWDTVDDVAATEPKAGGVLVQLPKRDASWWMAKLNQEAWKRSHEDEDGGAGHDTPTDPSGGAH